MRLWVAERTENAEIFNTEAAEVTEDVSRADVHEETVHEKTAPAGPAEGRPEDGAATPSTRAIHIHSGS